MGATMAEKILARAAGQNGVKPGQYVTAEVDLAMVHDAMAWVDEILERSAVTAVWDPSRIVCLFDHWNPPPTVADAENYKRARGAVKRFGISHFYGQNAGICHQVMVEKGHVVPGELIVGTDSHTLTYGALGAAGVGIGHTEMAYVMATGRLWFRVPETIRFDIRGALPRLVTPKDVILYIAGKYSTDAAQYRAVEFCGDTCRSMSLAGRMTVCNMAAEIGAKLAFFEPDEIVFEYLRERTKRTFTAVRPDADAVYEQVLEEDVSALEPQVAFPFSPGNVRPVSEVGDVRIDQAVLGSCTNGRLEDLALAAEVMGSRKVHPDVRMLVVPASQEVYREAVDLGVMSRLVESGAIICPPGCGPCMGAHMGLLAAGEVCISSTNRNFRGRMGSPDSEVYLASPATVAASAVSGRIADPRDF